MWEIQLAQNEALTFEIQAIYPGCQVLKLLEKSKRQHFTPRKGVGDAKRRRKNNKLGQIPKLGGAVGITQPCLLTSKALSGIFVLG